MVQFSSVWGRALSVVLTCRNLRLWLHLPQNKKPINGGRMTLTALKVTLEFREFTLLLLEKGKKNCLISVHVPNMQTLSTGMPPLTM